MKNYDRNKRFSYLMHLDANNLYGWAYRKLPVTSFKWVNNLSIKNEEFIRISMLST